MTYTSNIPYQWRFDAAAIYCSDGRFASAYELFLQEHLGLTHADRLVVPGGPGALVDHENAAIEADPLIDDLCFLAEAHHLNRIVLIMHEVCGFYLARIGVPEAELAAQQQHDMVIAANRLRDATGIARIEGYRAEIGDHGKIIFVPLPVE